MWQKELSGGKRLQLLGSPSLLLFLLLLYGLSAMQTWHVLTSGARSCPELSETSRAHDERVEAKVDGALISIGSAVVGMEAHRREADVHIRRIGSNEDRVNDLERKVSGLLSSPSARPDSYSGTDARKRAEAVDADFRGVREELKHHDRRLDALEIESFGRANGNGKVRK